MENSGHTYLGKIYEGIVEHNVKGEVTGNRII